MTRQYKRKRQIGYTTDANHNRKSINSGERWAAKREIASELNNFKSNKHDMSELRWEVEMYYTNKCFHADVGDSQCSCPNPDSWSDAEILKFLGLV